MVCPQRQGVSQCGHFADNGGGGQFFVILCERLLWTAPYKYQVRYQTEFRKNNTFSIEPYVIRT